MFIIQIKHFRNEWGWGGDMIDDLLASNMILAILIEIELHINCSMQQYCIAYLS